MKVNDKVCTPRFLTVTIKEVFKSMSDAYAAGYVEPTHCEQDGYVILGKSLDLYHMEFAAAKK